MLWVSDQAGSSNNKHLGHGVAGGRADQGLIDRRLRHTVPGHYIPNVSGVPVQASFFELITRLHLG
jgi:hypothetical protein